MEKTQKLIVIGDSAFAQIAYEYFTYDSPYEVVAFAVERAYQTRDSLFGLPVVAFEDIESRYPPETHAFYAALVYTQLNRLRARLYHAAKAKGYTPASYISSKAFVWRNAQVGEHCFIFEDNTVQPFVTLKDNVVLWSGNHIGHHSTIGENCFISSHVVISGFVNVGANCFFGVNATIGNDLTIGADCVIGAGASVVKDIPENTLVRPPKSDITTGTVRRYYGVERDGDLA